MLETLELSDLVDAMGEASRAESAAIARRLAAVGELYARRSVEWTERQLWCADPFDAVAAEVSAAQNISRGRASTQIRYGRELRERLCAVAAVFAAGQIDYRMVSTIIARTSNVTTELIAGLDAALASEAPRWMKLSNPKLVDRIDMWVAKFDADGVRVPPDVDKGRFVEVATTVPGMGGIWANIHATDAALFDQRLDALAATVCKEDPRTTAQRRADAVGALAAGADRLMCQCGSAECPSVLAPRPAPVVVHVLAEQATVDGSGDTPGYLPKFGIQPAESVRAMITAGRVTPLIMPKDGDQPRYRPSAALAKFLVWRDLTCRWPGCEAPAARCDTDHTVPYPAGPTHASNLKAYCRKHHLIKTFYAGENGWTDRQSPDGTITFTSPTGHLYTTKPGGALLFPALFIPTGELATPPTGTATAARGSTMPTRQRSREQDRQARIQQERRQRTELNAAKGRQKTLRETAAQAADYEPPPF